MPRMKQTASSVYAWFEHRAPARRPGQATPRSTPCPRSTASWWYVFGSAAFTLLVLQVVTGILLALVYVALGRRGVEQPQVPQSQTSPWAGFCAPCTAGDRTS